MFRFLDKILFSFWTVKGQYQGAKFHHSFSLYRGGFTKHSIIITCRKDVQIEVLVSIFIDVGTGSAGVKTFSK